MKMVSINKFSGILFLHNEQLAEGLKFGNKSSIKYVAYHRHNINVRIAAQTPSSSVADAIEFLRSSSHQLFQGAEGTIRKGN